MQDQVFPPAQEVNSARFAELQAKTWLRLNNDERKEYRALKEALGLNNEKPKIKKAKPAARVEHTVKVASTQAEPPVKPRTDEMSFIDKKNLLFQVFGSLTDADDKGKFQSIINDDTLLESLDMDQIYTKALWLVQDGDSRRVVKSAFNRE